MVNFTFSNHCEEMLIERKIKKEWVIETISNFDKKEIKSDNNMHFYKRILENENRVLHVVVNQNIEPEKIITIFFDRKAGRLI